jgi:hypothetical protein
MDRCRERRAEHAVLLAINFQPEGDTSLSCTSDSPLSLSGYRCLGQEQ